MTGTAVAVAPQPQRTGIPNLFTGLKRNQIRFLKAYMDCGTIRGSMYKARVDTRWHYTWFAVDNDYAVAFQRARDAFSDVAEGAIIGRGIHGVAKPLRYKGK